VSSQQTTAVCGDWEIGYPTHGNSSIGAWSPTHHAVDRIVPYRTHEQQHQPAAAEGGGAG